MEFTAQQIIHRLVELLLRIRHLALQLGKRTDLLGEPEHILQLNVLPLHPAHRRIAAGHGGAQRLSDDALRINAGKELLGSGVDQVHIALGHQCLNVRKILAGRSAAVVAHAPQHADNVLRLILRLAVDMECRLSQRRIIRFHAVDLDPAAVKALPPELVAFGRELAAVGAGDQIAVLSAFGQDLHQSAAVSEGVKIDRRRWADAEMLRKIAASDQNLPHNAFAARHVAVRLQKPAAHHMPFSLADQRLDLLKKRGIVPFNIPVDRHLVMAEDIVKFPRQIYGGTERGQRRKGALILRPLPDGVQMGVADQMNLFHGSTSCMICAKSGISVR